MKLNGKTTGGLNIQTAVFPRQDGDLVFRAAPVVNFEPCEKLCPRPEPVFIKKPGKPAYRDVESTVYKKQLEEWAAKRTHWMIIQSLSATPNLEFEKVNPSDSDTWHLYSEELKEFGLTDAEIAYLIGKITEACGMNAEKIDEATKSFLAMEKLQNETSDSLKDEA